MSKRKIMSVIVLCVLIPAVVVGGFFLAKGKQYYFTSLIIIGLSMLPFFLSLERKKLQVRELVIMASVIAIAVVSRAVFFFLQQAKPMCAILIITSVAFGAEFGFVSGALTMLISNFIYGQGMWTPFQMLAMAMTVFLSAVVIRTFKIKNRFIVGIISGIFCFAVYGIIVDLSSVFMMLSEFNFKSILSIYLSGLPFNIVHGVTTGVIVILVQPEINEKLDRIKIKYGLFGEKI
ncbi:MAG: ECF transporter S component [Clostridia bacterium]|nr:ECF transporter S component [Clostridia bacterium]